MALEHSNLLEYKFNDPLKTPITEIFPSMQTYSSNSYVNNNNSIRSQPQPSACQAMVDNRCCWTRGKVLGGSSVLNTMLYIRGNKRDFDQWESFGNPGWGYEDVLPYFRKSQDQRNPYLAKNKRQHGSGNSNINSIKTEMQ